MIRWNGKSLADLNRFEIEEVAAGAINELVNIRASQARRHLQDSYFVAFTLGIGFTLVACFVGISLH